MLYSLDDRFAELIEKDSTREGDTERKSLFYLLAGNEELYSKVDKIYDFKEHMIYLDILEIDKMKLSSSAESMLELGFNLYNGTETDLLSVFLNLDDDNFDLAINAIKIRFNKIDINLPVIDNN